ncbi:zinc-binding alcohol dehydrogenase family protein [Deinococcus sp. Leaf326]|uniref:zinc-binding alcohol dehydrogenase family protein n=1 Tax=Deinococcus sp. Leaf326 TaxID=1736338 RepID=UPI0006F6DC24|nr:zinc-binding alcohol dehydrogenase family protein [Deinococcus sp. Leaf326]KQR02622.1 Zn-dependent oxidoreductase [Deinococcus sp. Leaf326]
MPINTAAWYIQGHPTLEVAPAPYTSPGQGEIVVHTRAVAVNPVDGLIPHIGRFAYPWLKSPAVLGFDLAGEVVEVGPGVARFQVGDRVLALAVGTEKNRNSPAEGAFQTYAVVLERLACPLPDELKYEQAAVLPLALSTAACGLFQEGQLGLRHPSALPDPTGETVLIWGGATSVGSNAIQLATAAGYDVITTASPQNFEYVRSLGASQVFDYHREDVVEEVIRACEHKTLAGALSLATGSAGACIEVLQASKGRKVISMASTPVSFEPLSQKKRSPLLLPQLMSQMLATTALLQVKARRAGIRTSSIWGASLMNDAVGQLIFEDFLPAALASGRYRAAPEPEVVGHGLETVQLGVETHRQGVSARKVVISL